MAPYLAEPRDTGMNTFKIEKGIGIPTNGPSGSKYGWRNFEIGDSILVSENEKSARGAAYSFAIRHPGFKFIGRLVDGGMRIWRVEE